MDKAVRIHAARYGRHDFVKAALLVPHSDLPPGPSAVRHDDLHRAPDMDRTAPGNRRTRMQMDRQPDLLAFYTRFDNW